VAVFPGCHRPGRFDRMGHGWEANTGDGWRPAEDRWTTSPATPSASAAGWPRGPRFRDAGLTPPSSRRT
jgi:hypothetical protein